MSNVHLTLSADALLNMKLVTRPTTSEPNPCESQVRMGSSGNIHPYLFVTAADARAIALAFHELAAQIDEADDARAVPEGVAVLDITGDIEDQLQQAGVS